MTIDASIGGKASSLIAMNSIRGITVPSFTVVPDTLSKCEAEECVKAFLRTHPGLREVAVRSSASNEDSAQASFAGMFTSKLHVPANAAAIIAAADEIRRHGTTKSKVATHYAARRKLRSADQKIAVVVQEMVHADFSGVILSHNLRVRDGYYLVSVTQGVGEAIASGTTNGKLFRVARGIYPRDIKQAWLQQLVVAMDKIECHMQNCSLDVEFAFKENKLYILQCRPLATSPNTLIDKNNADELWRQNREAEEHVRAHHRGDVLGDMIDINPAELLGRSPSRLDIAIFGLLFADSVVERVRRDMGYDPLGVGLVRVVAGKPYVSLKASAFSFRPMGIPDHIYERLYSVYRNILAGDPGLQSRVEFAVFAMRDGEKLERVMEQARLASDERETVRGAYRNLDRSLVEVSGVCADAQETWRNTYELALKTDDSRALAEQLACVRDGTEQFVRVARLAFYWKNRFEEEHPEAKLNELLVGHIRSVSSKMQHDMLACRGGHLSRSSLVERYGHLRPGQFSVFGESYRDDPAHYLFDRLQWVRESHIQTCRHRYEATEEFRNVVTFMQAREETKFLFFRALDVFVNSLKEALASRGISHDTASQCSWTELEHLLRTGIWQPSADMRHRLPMILPDVIIPEVFDLGVIASHAAAASYITRKVVKARISVLDKPSEHEDVSGAIVVIPNADPGYDFLFHSGAAGIITRTGGPASHMCIRAVELQTPSCIGCGEDVYEALSRSPTAVLDCNAGQIIIPD